MIEFTGDPGVDARRTVEGHDGAPPLRRLVPLFDELGKHGPWVRGMTVPTARMVLAFEEEAGTDAAVRALAEYYRWDPALRPPVPEF